VSTFHGDQYQIRLCSSNKRIYPLGTRPVNPTALLLGS
jgi:hypothetical protein